MNIQTILVVEDTATNQVLARIMLERLGYRVEVAENGVQAIEKLKTTRYDLVFMDLQMPIIDGYDTVRRIRNELNLDSTALPVIAMTAHSSPEDITRCYDAGMNDILIKPIEFIELAAKLEEWLGDDSDSWNIPENNETAYQAAPFIAEAELKSLISFIGVSSAREAYDNFMHENESRFLTLNEGGQDKESLQTMLHNMISESGHLGMKKLSLYCRHLLNRQINQTLSITEIETDILKNTYQESCRLFEQSIKKIV